MWTSSRFGQVATIVVTVLIQLDKCQEKGDGVLYISIVTNLSDCLKTENFTENFIANLDLPKSLTMLSIQKKV